MNSRNTIQAEIVDFLKGVGKLVASGLAQNAITKHVVPKVQKVGVIVLDKMAHLQGRKDVEDLDRLARQSEQDSPPPVAVTPPPAIEPESDGPVEARFV